MVWEYQEAHADVGSVKADPTMKIGLPPRTFRQPTVARPSFRPKHKSRLSLSEMVGASCAGLRSTALNIFGLFQHRKVAASWIVVPTVIGAGVTAFLLVLTPSAPIPSEQSVRPGQSQILYAPLANLEVADTSLIDSAKSALNVAAYSLTDGPIIEALRSAKLRGVAVRIVLDRTQLHAHERLSGLYDEIRVKRSGPLMHLKAYSVDGSVLRTGSANLSHGGLLLQDNDLLVNRDPTIVAAFDHRFEDMWSSAEPIGDMATTKSQ